MTDLLTDGAFAALASRLADAGLEHWTPEVPERVARALGPRSHGDLARWRAELQRLSGLPRAELEIDGEAVACGRPGMLDDRARHTLHQALAALHPWRKGPFRLFGVDIDAEWRSDLKWARVAAAGVPLKAARVLDVGCGNGWYAWRMQAAGARTVVGVDPTLKHVMQAIAVRRCIAGPGPEILPLALEDLPPGQAEFDVVFSMGVLYHRRSPLDHLARLRDHLAPGGTLVLESLVVPGPVDRCLVPTGRYANMRNVWFLPSTAMLCVWLERAGFDAPRVVDESMTTPAEQRRTPWMRFESLAAALDPDDPGRTVEGHPAPRRALLVATRRSRTHAVQTLSGSGTTDRGAVSRTQ